MGQPIDDLVPLLGGARVPRFFPMRGNCLSVEFEFDAREVFIGYRVYLFVDPINFAFKDRNTTKYKVLVVLTVGIARFVDVEQVHTWNSWRSREEVPRAHGDYLDVINAGCASSWQKLREQKRE